MIGTYNALMAWGFGAASLAYAALALLVARQGYFRPPVNRPGLAIMLAALLTTTWAGLSLLAQSVPVLWMWAAVADVCRYAAWFAFVVYLFRASAEQGRSPETARWMVPMAVALPVLSLLSLVVSAFWMQPASGAPVGLFLTMMLLSVLGLVLVEQLFRNLPEDALWSAKPICLGLAGTFLFDLYLYSQAVLFNGIDQDAWNIRGIVHAALMPLLLLSTTRHRNWIAKIRVSRKVVFHSATLLMAGGYLMFIAGVGYYVRYFGSDWGRALQLALVFLALVFLIALALSRSFRARLRVTLGKHFFSYRYDYREEWLKFTQTLSSQSAPGETGLNVIRGLADMLESPAGMLWLRRPDEKMYRQVARWNLPQISQTEPVDSPLLAFMQRSGWVVNLEEYRNAPERYDNLTLPEWLQGQPQAWLLVPLWLGQDLLGFVVLGSPRTRMDVNWEVTDLLKTAGRQAASFLAQMQSTEALLEARKFEAFSRMSAFVVHDLKNIVTQLSLMVKNAKRLSHNPEFQADMLMTVENSLERMRQLMLQLREGAAPGGAAVGVDLGQVAKGLAASVARRGRELELDIQPRVATRGHEERLERVMGHLVNNALDATESPQRVWLKIDRFGSHARVEVGDNGMGMSESFVQERLFKPFQTTKEAGMGIGAYESFQYVQELGGKVKVDSKEGEGTVVTLLLPLIESFHESDWHQMGEA
ncbi:XrtA/PEP-CTERM system histidine kinase PrsK [Hydrogenophaga sp.]|uniref:XrtA/PEP-CTERM system histidine kinase PrsK n=1 Tax=Hydrogenophaga sp. TaxID=1904254 RepID=UPI00272EF553|nr:XrtA/PEP-CTERM system histidine kinase PrsK [Hydrogenophaga sp.]MDP1684492.1 PEP-CTERM system histidine kinase PrsK [Hydrogenophaga sp.]